MFIRCQSGGIKEATNPRIQDVTHLIIVGRTGIQKTVFLKSVIEDMVLADIPVIVVDPKGDIASLGIPKAFNQIWPNQRRQYRAFWDKAEIRIWTPKTDEGRKLSLNPFVPHYKRLSPIKQELFIENIVQILVNMTTLKKDTNQYYAFVEQTYDVIHSAENEFQNITELLEYMEEKHPTYGACRVLRKINIGTRKIMLNTGAPLNMDSFLSHAPGRVPVNIISLMPLFNKEELDFFVDTLATMVYRWGITNQQEKNNFSLQSMRCMITSPQGPSREVKSPCTAC